ncbi:MAG: TRAP transporter small permease [Kiloniellales bacterium]|nr:TRAP transporter small permease [Kiloniellales bacterium]
MRHTLGALLGILDRWFEETACAVLISVMGAMIFLQVIMRYVFSHPLSWTDEVAVYCMVWSVYLGGSLAVRERAHIRVLNGIRAFGGRTSLALIVLSDSLWAAINLLLIWQGLVLEISFWEQPYISPALGIDQKWPYLIVPFGFALMTLRLGQIYLRWFLHGEPPIGRAESA